METEQLQVEKEEKNSPKSKIKKVKVVQATGKRKAAIAKATLYPEGKGIVRINSQLLAKIEPLISRHFIGEPLVLAGDVANTVNIDVTVTGGGFSGQAAAARLAIARALSNYDKKLKKIFSGYDKFLIVADTRFKEKRKPNDSKARSNRQSSKR